MPAAYTSIEIRDGVTTCVLTDGTNYALVEGGWSPQLAERRVSVLGGLRYEDVTEEITINVFGATAAAALLNLQTLVNLIDQAQDYTNGDAVNGVYLIVATQGGLSGGYTTPIRGPDGRPATLPPTYNDLLMVYEIANVTIRFRRMGIWMTRETATASATAADPPSIRTATFATSITVPSPASVLVSEFPIPTSIGSYDTGYLLVARTASKIKLIDGFGFANGGVTFAGTNADTARKPRGGDTLVTSTISLTPVTSATVSLSDWSTRLVGVVASIRNESPDRTFEIVVRLRGYGVSAETAPFHVDYSTAEPRIVFLGLIAAETKAWQTVELDAWTNATGGAGTQRIHIDDVALIALDDPCSRILSHGPVSISPSIPNTDTSTLYVQTRDISDTYFGMPAINPEPVLTWRNTGGVTGEEARPQWHRGDIRLLSAGNEIACLYLGRNSTYYRLWNPVTAAAVPITLAAYRYPATLVPA